MHDGQVERSIGMTLLCRDAVIIEGKLVVHVDAEAIAIQQPHAIRGIGVAGVRKILPLGFRGRVVKRIVGGPAFLEVAGCGANGVEREEYAERKD